MHIAWEVRVRRHTSGRARTKGADALVEVRNDAGAGEAHCPLVRALPLLDVRLRFTAHPVSCSPDQLVLARLQAVLQHVLHERAGLHGPSARGVVTPGSPSTDADRGAPVRARARRALARP